MRRRIYDTPKVLLLCTFFVALALFPFGMVLASRDSANRPLQLEKAARGTTCIEDAKVMRATHMTLLHSWRDESVRQSDDEYTSSSGARYEKSLTKTCLNCHPNEQKFCAPCHAYAGVTNDCFNCHIAKGGE